MRNVYSRLIWICFLGLVFIATDIVAQDQQEINADTLLMPPVCGTSMYNAYSNLEKNSKNADCPIYGPCDDPAMRDSQIPDENTPIKYISLFFQSVCNDDGASPWADIDDVLFMMNELNELFEPWRIQFTYDWRFIYSTDYLNVDMNSTDNNLKNDFVKNPLNYINIYVTRSWSNFSGQYYTNSYATYPWWGGESSTGGIVLAPRSIGNHSTLTHEVGHCIGLWHTFEFDGTFWTEPCGPCYDSPGGGDDDVKGDMCSDTPPEPVSYNCSYPGGVDSCSNQPWGETDWSNYMGYAVPFSCHNHFTPQQAGRMHCWSEYATPGWISYAKIESDVNLGPVPLDVQFEGVTSVTPYSWDWDFGDELSGSGVTPSHIYTEPGVYNASVIIDAAEGTFDAEIARDIWVYADTMVARSTTATVWQPVRVDIYARISVPVSDIVLPLNWSGPGYLMLDSISTAGLRTESCATPDWLTLDQMNSGALHLQTVIDGLAMVPDTGSIVSLWFTPVVTGAYVENDVRIEPSLSSYDLEFETIRGSYTPEVVNGQVIVFTKGDANGDGDANIGDAVYIISNVFKGGPLPNPLESGDANCDGDFNIGDAVYLINHVFKGGPGPC